MRGARLSSPDCTQLLVSRVEYSLASALFNWETSVSDLLAKPSFHSATVDLDSCCTIMAIPLFEKTLSHAEVKSSSVTCKEWKLCFLADPESEALTLYAQEAGSCRGPAYTSRKRGQNLQTGFNIEAFFAAAEP